MYHNPDRNIKKLDDRALKGMFLGFNEDNYTYIIWDLEANQVIESRDVKPVPDHAIEFENNDWDAPFETYNDNNWLTGETPIILDDDQDLEESNNPPIVDNDDFPPQGFQINNNNNNLNNNNLNPNLNIDIDSEEDPPLLLEVPDEDILGNPIPRAIQQPPRAETAEPPTRETRSRHASFRTEPHQTRSKPNVQHFALSTTQVQEVLNLDQVSVPNSYKEAITCELAPTWKKSIEEENSSLIEYETFKVVPRTQTMKPIKLRYVFKIKTDDQNRMLQIKISRTRVLPKAWCRLL